MSASPSPAPRPDVLRFELDATDGAYASVGDRREAIRAAITWARSEDTVVIAGKGHEDYQIVGRERLPFSDTDEARRALRARAET